MKIFRTPIYFPWFFPRRRWGFSSASKSVYLTFDDGPTPELSNWILEYLAKEDIRATFFCVGANAKSYPELMNRMIREGHAIGNHTMHHEKGTKVSKREYIESIKEASNYIDSTLFRPPYGRLPMIYGRSIRKNYKIVMWSWLSYDYDKSVPISEILEEASRIKAGDVLVVHDNEKVMDRIKELLPQMVQIIREKELTFEVISA
ncbi:MAG: polysaccharide deacetylase family protein [Fluviicola sp.]|nr:MAG: polysaccharide deacetylase family protein [Fluviicola sp.]